MQICSFLPSATEILYALGMGESVSGVTFEVRLSSGGKAEGNHCGYIDPW